MQLLHAHPPRKQTPMHAPLWPAASSTADISSSAIALSSRPSSGGHGTLSNYIQERTTQKFFAPSDWYMIMRVASVPAVIQNCKSHTNDLVSTTEAWRLTLGNTVKDHESPNSTRLALNHRSKRSGLPSHSWSEQVTCDRDASEEHAVKCVFGRHTKGIYANIHSPLWNAFSHSCSITKSWVHWQLKPMGHTVMDAGGSASKRIHSSANWAHNLPASRLP